MAESAPGGMTKLSTMLQAVGRPMAFGGEFIKCKSKGTLEASIADAARLWMAKSA
jgi:hypothetical protein